MKLIDIMTEEQYNVVDILDCTVYFNSGDSRTIKYIRGDNKPTYDKFLRIYPYDIGGYSFNNIQTKEGILLVESMYFFAKNYKPYKDETVELPTPQEVIPGITSAVDIRKAIEQSDIVYTYDSRISAAYWEFHIKGDNINDSPSIDINKIEPDLWNNPYFVQNFTCSAQKKKDRSKMVVTTLWMS